jgi:hypothetical protein
MFCDVIPHGLQDARPVGERLRDVFLWRTPFLDWRKARNPDWCGY